MKYKVRYEDNNGNDETIEFSTVEEAEKFIDEDLNRCIELVKDYNWDYGMFGRDTELWTIGNDFYHSWKRLW